MTKKRREKLADPEKAGVAGQLLKQADLEPFLQMANMLKLHVHAMSKHGFSRQEALYYSAVHNANMSWYGEWDPEMMDILFPDDEEDGVG